MRVRMCEAGQAGQQTVEAPAGSDPQLAVHLQAQSQQ